MGEVIDELFEGLANAGMMAWEVWVFSEIELNYKALLNGLALVAFVALLYLTVHRGATEETEPQPSAP